MTISEAWSFLVSRNQFIDYRTVVAPDFICDARIPGMIAKVAEGDLTESGVAWYREVHGSKVGNLTLVFRVIEATAENTGIPGSGILKDAFGRDVYLIEGIVLKGIHPEVVVTEQIFDVVHAKLVEQYREFWSQTTSDSAVSSESFMLVTDGVKLECRSLKEYVFGTKLVESSQKKIAVEKDTSTEQARLWQSYSTNKFDGEIISVCCSRDGSFVAFRYDRTIIIQNWQTQENNILISERKLLADSPTPIVISNNGKFIASGFIESFDQNVVKIWNIETKQDKSFHDQKLSTYGRIRSVAITPNSETLLSGGEDQIIKIWDIESGGEIGDFAEHSSAVRAIAISSDSQTVGSGDGKGIIKFWNLRTRKSTYTIEAHSLPVNSIAFSPNGQIAASSSDDYSIKLWNTKSGKEICTLGQHSAPVNSIAFSSDGNLIASGADDHLIKIWDVSIRKAVAVLSGHSKPVTSVAFITGKQTLISGSKDCTIRLWSK